MDSLYVGCVQNLSLLHTVLCFKFSHNGLSKLPHACLGGLEDGGLRTLAKVLDGATSTASLALFFFAWDSDDVKSEPPVILFAGGISIVDDRMVEWCATFMAANEMRAACPDIFGAFRT